MKKTLLTTLFLSFLLLPVAASAQLDQRCFTAEQCRSAREGLVKESGGSQQEAAGGFVNDNLEVGNVCGGEKNSDGTYKMGFCLPAGQTSTKISFGGRTRFAHLGDFIQYMYRYAIVVAGIAAILVIIGSGFQWLTSGGNTEAISSARKRIWNAIMGLVLATGSYLLLSSLNPYLTQLRLPQIWLVNQQGLVPALCSDTQGSVKFSKAFEQTEQSPNLDQALADADFTGQTTADCGSSYFASIDGKTAGSQTCLGTVCPQSLQNRNQVCLRRPDNPALWECKEGNIGGIVSNSNPFQEILPFTKWEFPWFNEGETEIWAICDDGTTKEISSSDQTSNLPNDTQRYVVKTYNAGIQLEGEVAQICRSTDRIKGFYLVAESNKDWSAFDQKTYIGIGGIDLGDETTFERDKRSIPKEKFITLRQLLNGVQIDIDVSNIKRY